MNGEASDLVVEIDADVADLVEAYLEARRDGVSQLRSLQERGDFEAIRHLAHGLAGSGLSYGFEPISAMGARLENAATGRNAAAVQAEVEALADYLARVRWRVRAPLGYRV